MTDKRFQWVYIKDNSLELRDNGIVKVFNNERLEELLNELDKENEQLKQDILRLMYTAEHLVDIKKLEEKWDIDYNQFLSDLINGDEHL